MPLPSSLTSESQVAILRQASIRGIMATKSGQLNGYELSPNEHEANGVRIEDGWKVPRNCRNTRHCKCYFIFAILLVSSVFAFLYCCLMGGRCSDTHSPNDPTGPALSCLVRDAKQALECMGCDAPTLMKLPMSRYLLGHFIPDVDDVVHLGCLSAASYCSDPGWECCPDQESKVSRNISVEGEEDLSRKKLLCKIYEFAKCKCQPRDECFRREEVVIVEVLQEDYV